MVAAYLAGRSENRFFQQRGIEGRYLIVFPQGARREVSLTHLGDDQYQLVGCGVLDGAYRLKDNQLLIVRPQDKRMVGLMWTRRGQDWTLIKEPAGTPTGSSYVGAVLQTAGSND